MTPEMEEILEDPEINALAKSAHALRVRLAQMERPADLIALAALTVSGEGRLCPDAVELELLCQRDAAQQAIDTLTHLRTVQGATA